MNASKEQILLKLAATGPNSKVEHLVKGINKLKRWLSRDRLDDILEDDQDQTGNGEGGSPRKNSVPIVMHKQVTPHVDVNCTDDLGSTPMIIASLNGHRDIVHTLIAYSADIHAADRQGNTALHMASWQNRSEIVELLLLNGAWTGVVNKEGNTPLHFAAQHCPAGKTLTIVKLLQHDASPLIANHENQTPLDMAIKFNRKEAVALLVDADEESLNQAKFLVDACIAGRKEIVEILLEAGMDPNSFDSETGLMPLHEAVRYFRKDAAALLLKFGAQPGIRNGKSESSVDIVNSHPEHRQSDFMKLFKDYHGQRPQTARAKLVKKQSREEIIDTSETSFGHPLLKNRKCWLKDTTDYCSAATKKHPASAVLDSDPLHYWMIPAPGSYNWIAFDFGSEFTLTGLRIHGWGNKTMIYSFMVEVANLLEGPWVQVGKYQADLLGPEEFTSPPEGQDFKGFYAKSRFWRITVADNYGANHTFVSSIEFYGVEDGIVEWFRELGMGKYIKKFVESGYNQFSELAIINDEQMKRIVRSSTDRQKILDKAHSLKGTYYPPSGLKWAIKPIDKATENKPLPDFSIMSDPFTVGDLQVKCQGNGHIIGRDRVQLIPRDNGYPSRANFTGISISPAGNYIIEVQSVSDASVVLTLDKPIEITPPPKRHSEINRVFQGFEDMMNFDI